MQEINMNSGEQPKNPVAERMKKRHEQWEKERLEEVRRQVEAGLLTEEEGRERGL
jgi:hypothetical protein